MTNPTTPTDDRVRRGAEAVFASLLAARDRLAAELAQVAAAIDAARQHEDQGAIAPDRVLAGLAVLEWPDDRTNTVLPGVHYQTIEAVIRAADRAGGRDHQCDPVECTCELTTADAPRTLDDGHIVTVDDGGAWHLDHPDGCWVPTPAGRSLICLVHDLCVEQLGTAQLGVGRYQVGANDLGDRLLIGDRIPDADTATTVPCRCEDPAGRDYPHQPGTGRYCSQAEG